MTALSGCCSDLRRRSRSGDRELLVVRIVTAEQELADAGVALAPCRPGARTAAFTSEAPADDLVGFATAHEADIIVVDAPPGFDGDVLPVGLATLLERSPAQLAVVAGEPGRAGPVYVPFGGGEHDWAALELAAWLASATAHRCGCSARAPSRAPAAATRAACSPMRRSRFSASWMSTSPRCLPTRTSIVAAVEPAALVVVGISPRWRAEGIGETRRSLVREAGVPVVVVHRGPRPGGLAPRESRTRFTWTVGAQS